MAEAMIPYRLPQRWIQYDVRAVIQELVDAKAAALALKASPYQRDWVQKLQDMQLKMEVAGTSRIEGADFTEGELDAALTEPPAALLTRSQKQASAAVATYRWIAQIPEDMPLTAELIKEVHRRIVTGCDDDHCAPGELRGLGQNVTFGYPRHRGAEGGDECALAFAGLVEAVQREFRGHDPLVQAIALHYHFAAMHPFLDGNGRTARALEALLLQRSGLRDTAFIAMSNYYYEEKPAYLAVLAEVRARQHDLTPFLVFGLKGIAKQCGRLFHEIRKNVKKAVFQTMMYDLFLRLESPRKRVLAERQIKVLRLLLELESTELLGLIRGTKSIYAGLRNPDRALVRDLNALIHIGCINGSRLDEDRIRLDINLEWPEQITETDFIQKIRKLPKAKTHSFL